MSRAVRILADRASSAQGAGTETSGTIWRVDEYSELTVMVNATAVSGTGPQLEVTLQTSDTNTASALWHDLLPPERFVVASVEGAAFTRAGFGKYVRTKRTVTGASTPTVTYTIQISAKT